MDPIRAMLIIEVLSVFVVVCSFALLLWLFRPKMQKKKSTYKPAPIKKRTITTPDGDLVLTDKRAPIDNSDESLWEREN